MKPNRIEATNNLANTTNHSVSKPLTIKKLLLCSLAWCAALALFTAIAIAQQPAPQQQTAPQQAVQRTDGNIELDVVQALDSSKSLKSESITAATIQGEVTLTGNVSNESARELAEMLTTRVSGVTHVHNNLTVAGATPETAPQQPVTQAEIQSEQPAEAQPAPQQMAQNDPPPPHVQLPPTDTASADEGVATQTVIPTQQTAPIPAPLPPTDQAQPQPAPQTQRPAYTQQAPPAYPNNGPQHPQSQPNQNYGTHAPAPPYDPTPLNVRAGTVLDLRTVQFLDSKHAKVGTTFDLTVVRDVYVAGRLAIPMGAIVHGSVVESKSSGQLDGAPTLALKLDSIDLGANNYPLATDLFKVRGPNKAGYSVGNIFGGATLGALIGGAVGRGPGAAIGAIAGAGTGTAISAGTPGPRAWIPAEAHVTFHLSEPVTVVPVTPQEALRLAQSVMPGGPTLYNRRGTGYYAGYAPPGYYGAGYPYPAPMPFYHPFYYAGGYYYWR